MILFKINVVNVMLIIRNQCQFYIENHQPAWLDAVRPEILRNATEYGKKWLRASKNSEIN